MVHDDVLKSAHESPHKSSGLFEVSLLAELRVELLVSVFSMLNCLVSFAAC